LLAGEIMTKSLLVATHNFGKVKEYADMLSDLDIDWQSLDDIGLAREVEETGSTFLENAVLKASAYARDAGCLTLADDSGLVVDALDGAPGVNTARYGGSELSSRERYEYLLGNLKGVPIEERTARFVCIIALAGVDGEILATAEGTAEGFIALEPVGEGGFGYDPVFYIPQAGKTMAELPPQMKHALSHRGNALRAIEPQLRAILADDR
jgi:XTP/dITP diphosphohydrolase